MLIATVTALVILFGGGAGDHTGALELLSEFSSLIQEHVEDPTRAAEAQEIVAATQLRLQELGMQISDRQQALLALDRQHDIEKEELEAEFAKHNALWDAGEAAIIEGQMELREKITESEWNAIYDDLKRKRK